jgi:hypothetical protein
MIEQKSFETGWKSATEYISDWMHANVIGTPQDINKMKRSSVKALRHVERGDVMDEHMRWHRRKL